MTKYPIAKEIGMTNDGTSVLESSRSAAYLRASDLVLLSSLSKRAHGKG